jgi:Fanconi anemia group M protein
MEFNVTDRFVNHPMLADSSVEARTYQTKIAENCIETDSLVVLPTGTGKTAVSLLISAERLRRDSSGISLMLAPTKPLVEQHAQMYRDLFDIPDSEVCVFTGEIKPEKRSDVWGKQIVVATPQVIENDILANRIDISDVTHLTFDECHKATGNYPYTFIAKKYSNCEHSLITGLSASPGESQEEILNVCNNINVNNVEVMTENDDELSPYVYDISVEPKFIEIDDTIIEARDKLQTVFKNRLKWLKSNEYSDTASKTTSRRKLQGIRSNIQDAMDKDDSDAYQAMSYWAECMKLSTAIEYLETQGVDAFLQYIERLKEEKDKNRAQERLTNNDKVIRASKLLKQYDGTYEKLEQLKVEIVESVGIDGESVLVFTESRDTVEHIVQYLSNDFEVNRLVGQQDSGSTEGMTQQEQQNTIEQFRNEKFDVLVSTAVGEEGIDIPSVGLVVFYEPTSKGIRYVQRMGRTGRIQSGRVSILIAKNTRDVGYYYSSKNAIENMSDNITQLKQIKNLEQKINTELSQSKLSDSFSSAEQNSNSGFAVVADHRETNANVVNFLSTDESINLDINNNMSVADYVIGQQTAIERKSISDLHDTITGQRSLFEQIKDMSESYDSPVLIVEGGGPQDVYSTNINNNAIRGVLSSVALDFNCPIIYSQSQSDTANIIKMMAKRVQEQDTSDINPHGNKSTKTLSEQQEYIISSIDTVGVKTARSLLSEFGTIRKIILADTDELTQVDGVGETTASKIQNIITSKYTP